jgi:uroporphyrinogen decarboxylase
MTKNFDQKKVVSFESRMALPSLRQIEKLNGIAISAPTLKEVELEEVKPVFDFYQNIVDGKVDYLVLMTGVAIRGFIKILAKKIDKEEIIETLNTKTEIIIRGPKPESVCKRNNINFSHKAEEPNTWKELLTYFQSLKSESKNLAILEYGISNQEFINELEKLQFKVSSVQVYTWSLPDDLEPLKSAIDQIINRKIDIALFTSASQVDHLIKVARMMELERELRKGFYTIAIFSIGPVCSEKLNSQQLFVDYEVFPNKLNHLIEEASKLSDDILTQKRNRHHRIEVYQENIKNNTSSIDDSLMMRALRLESNARPPIWIMRQAGRYMEEYQISRRNKTFLEVCKNPETCAEITLTAMERLGVDAGIIFSDILPLLETYGFNLRYEEGKGPIISPPLRLASQLKNFKKPDIQKDLDFVYQAINLTRTQLNKSLPLLGFSGAPFTLASYLIEGGSSKNYIFTKTFMRENQESWFELMEALSKSIIEYLKLQKKAGANAVQLFDSWAGILTPDEYDKFVAPYSKKIIDEVIKEIPIIHFGSFTFDQLSTVKDIGGTGISLDWKIDFFKAIDFLGDDFAVQGNLDPTLLFASPDYFLPIFKSFLDKIDNRKGFIFNLGHGILPKTPVNHVMRLIDFIHEYYEN